MPVGQGLVLLTIVTPWALEETHMESLPGRKRFVPRNPGQ